jgi:hypothetical protein
VNDPRTPQRDPRGKRALFEAPAATAAETSPTEAPRRGRDALFSTSRREPGTVVVECSSCGARTRVALTDAIRRLLSFSLFVPLLKPRQPHRITCPACRRRTWCRIGWTE